MPSDDGSCQFYFTLRLRFIPSSRLIDFTNPFNWWGAKSAVWRQMIADIMNTEVVCLKEDEAAALGGAIQAMWVNGEGL